MNPTFAESHENSPSSPMPISLRYARAMEVPEHSPIPYDPATQMSVYGGDTMNMMGKDRSTCTRSSSTKESILYGGNADSDRATDD